MNDRTGYFLVALVIAAPVPQASLPMVWWLVLSALILLATTSYMLRGARLDPGRPLQLMRHRAPFLLVLPVLFFILLQGLPLAGLFPAGLHLPALPVEPPASISVLPTATLAGALRVLAYMAFFALALEAGGQAARAERLGWLIFFGIVAHAVWALVALNLLGDYVPWGEKPGYQGVATGTFVNRNSFATFLGFGVVLGIALSVERARGPRIRQSRGRHLLSAENVEIAAVWVAVAVIGAALAATGSRLGAAATLVAVAAVALVLRAKSGASPRRVMAEAAAVVLAFGILALAQGGTEVVERMLFISVDSGSRADIYAQILPMIAARPLAGYGWDAFAPAFELFRQPGLNPDGSLLLAHSTYLTLWVELGLVIGSLPVIAALVVGVSLVRRLVRRTTHLAMPAAGLGALVLGGVHSLFDFSLEMPANMLLFLALLALGAARRRKQTGQ